MILAKFSQAKQGKRLTSGIFSQVLETDAAGCVACIHFLLEGEGPSERTPWKPGFRPLI